MVHLIHSMQFLTIQDVHYALMMHKTRLEQQNTHSQIFISNTSANVVYNNSHSNGSRSSSRGISEDVEGETFNSIVSYVKSRDTVLSSVISILTFIGKEILTLTL